MQQNGDLKTRVGKPVKVSLSSNPTTGYQWEPIYDKAALRIESEYQRGTGGMGGGGEQVLKVVPLRRGVFVLRVRYKRPWETEGIEEREFRVTATE